MFVLNACEHTGLDPHVQCALMGRSNGSQANMTTPVLNVATQGGQRTAHRTRVINNQGILPLPNLTRKCWIEHQAVISPTPRTKGAGALNNVCLYLQAKPFCNCSG